MNDKKRKYFERDDHTEDVTEYGEFIPSYYAWMTLEEQKRKAKYLEELSNEIAPTDDEERR